MLANIFFVASRLAWTTALHSARVSEPSGRHWVLLIKTSLPPPLITTTLIGFMDIADVHWLWIAAGGAASVVPATARLRYVSPVLSAPSILPCCSTKEAMGRCAIP
jgi:hypothetical protein